MVVGGMVLAGLAACGSTKSEEERLYLFEQLEQERFREDVGWDTLRQYLPAFPSAKTSWIEVGTVNTQTPFRHFIDAGSVAIAPGQIVRYTLKSESDRGAVNISYESIRCGVAVWKTVAIGGTDAWEQARNDEWRSIERGGVQDTLRRGVMCSGGGVASTKESQLLYRLKNWENYNLQTANENG